MGTASYKNFPTLLLSHSTGNVRYLSFSLQLQYLSAELNTELNNKFEVQSGIYYDCLCPGIESVWLVDELFHTKQWNDFWTDLDRVLFCVAGEDRP